MASARIDIISIGTLSRNRIWNETEPTRTAHATTTLIRTGNRMILVDPGLPPPILAARLSERAGITADRIDTIFLTNFRQPHRAGISLFSNATLLIHENELAAAREFLERMVSQAPEEDEDRRHFERELDLLGTLSPAEDKLAPGVDLFPLFGYTAGTCGLLISAPTTTTLIAGDAVPTLDHFLAGQVLPDTADIKAAQEAMSEVYEIADIIVPGHDNLFVSPRIQGV
jgi:glyoxylase-like metal-dependent hydrolase (beta-lactamase superfamily II)